HQPEIAVHGAPEAFEVVDRPAVQRREVAVAVVLGEAAQPAAGEIALGRTPGDVHAATGARSGARFAPLRAPVSSERVQRADCVLVSARDAGAPAHHIPEVLQAGGIATCSEPQHRRAGGAELTRQEYSRRPVE